MNKVEQAAKYAEENSESLFPYGFAEVTNVLSGISNAFSAGYEAAEGAFAEWCSENSWYYVTSYKSWKQALGRANWKTTAELYQLWQQQTQSANSTP